MKTFRENLKLMGKKILSQNSRLKVFEEKFNKFSEAIGEMGKELNSFWLKQEKKDRSSDIEKIGNPENPFKVDSNFKGIIRSSGDSSRIDFNFLNHIHINSEQFDHTRIDTFEKFAKLNHDIIGNEMLKTVNRKIYYMNSKNSTRSVIIEDVERIWDLMNRGCMEFNIELGMKPIQVEEFTMINANTRSLQFKWEVFQMS
jgi:hypothetical protein